MNRVHEELRANLPSFVLGDLDMGERSAVEAHLRTCTECRSELKEVQAIGELSSTALLEFQPPRDLEDRTFALIAVEAGEPATTKFARTRRLPRIVKSKSSEARTGFRPQMILAPGLAAAFIGLAVLAAGLWMRADDLQQRLEETSTPPRPEVAQVVDLNPRVGGADATSADVVRVDEQNYEIVLTSSGLPPTPDGYRYELWVGTGKGGWVSAGTFKTGGDSREEFDFQVGVDPIDFPVIDITRERANGDPKRTGREIMRGKIDITAL